MMRIPQDIVNSIKQNVEIKDVVERLGVPLKKSGGRYWASSPWSSDTNHSFSVSPDKNLFYCFSTSKGGDAVAFVMEFLGIGYREALEEIANMYNIPIPDEDIMDDSRIPMYERMKAYQSESFLKLAKNARILEYLSKRGIPRPVVAKFKVGISADIPRISQADIDSGLVKESDDGYYVFFKNRILFPFRNIVGTTTGFTGRALGNSRSKYKNSPESSVFSKSREVYGIFENKALIRKKGYVVCVEGQMDVLSYAAINEPSVAGSGTSLSDHQAKMITRLANKVYLHYDKDIAGKKASIRALKVMLQYSTEIYFVNQKGDDPNADLVSGNLVSPEENSVAWYKKLISDIQRVPSFMIGEKTKLTNELREAIGCMGDQIHQTYVMQHVSSELGLVNGSASVIRSPGNQKPKEKPMDTGKIEPTPEFQAMRFAVHYPSHSEIVMDILRPIQFTNSPLEILRGSIVNGLPIGQIHEQARSLYAMISISPPPEWNPIKFRSLAKTSHMRFLRGLQRKGGEMAKVARDELRKIKNQ